MLPGARGELHAGLERIAARDPRADFRSCGRCFPRRGPSIRTPQRPRGRVTGPPKPETIVRAFHDACLAELDALKPGNVHRFRDGHRMTIADFMASADAAAPAIGRAGLPVGARIRLAVEATATAVGQNTNLGMVLLAAPLANAALDQGKGDLQRRLARVLAGLTVDDARETYQAIRAVK